VTEWLPRLPQSIGIASATDSYTPMRPLVMDFRSDVGTQKTKESTEKTQ
jgi:hypothetical protein